MNMNEENEVKDTSVTKTQSGKIRIAIIVLVLALPLVWLFYKTSGQAPVAVEETPPAQVAPPAVSNIPALEAAVNENPSFDNLVNLSMAYINNNMPGKSIDHLKQAIELNPKSAIAYNNLGVAYTMLQQYQNGADACTKALEIDPSFQLAKNNLKWASDEKDKVLTAIAELEKVKSDKRDAPYYMGLGLDYFQIGNYDKAIQIWTKASEKDPKSGAPLSSIGTAFMMKNQVDDAIAIFQKAIAMNPDDQLAKNNLAWAMGEKAKAK
jgi:protein O-mannosyl-transferase